MNIIKSFIKLNKKEIVNKVTQLEFSMNNESKSDMMTELFNQKNIKNQ